MEEVRAKVGDDRVICGLSGGVDSSVAAALVQRAVGDQLTCVFVDHGLLRSGEREQVENDFVEATGVDLVTVDATDQFLDALEAESAQKRGEYRIEQWVGEIPEEHLSAYGRLLTQLEIDEPDEEVEHEPAEYTPERIRVSERRMREAGTIRIVAVAVAPDGEFVGNSEVHVHEAPGSTLGYQENTLVMPEHRGHRLGLGLKVATHRRLAELAPQLRSLVTWNSHVNPWMIQVNEKLGYELLFHEVVMQGRRAG